MAALSAKHKRWAVWAIVIVAAYMLFTRFQASKASAS